MTELSGRRVTADAVVVNYNAGEALTGCVESLLSAGVDRVFVVDNCSTDGSLEALDESVSVITTGSNRGYGSAANVGVAAATSDLVLVCNPDLVVDVQAVGLLEASLRADTGLAVVAPRLLTPEGETYPSARGFPRLVDALGHAFVGLVKPDNPYTRRYKRLDTDPDLAGEVDWVSGAC
ncbi:MAG TPA: glycosyltransferase, partial [Acidimicrobiales bacterium]|nr:glycosyltransferase [Acidimicrobiales bacterium]